MRHPAAEGPLRFWYGEASHASWKNLMNVRKSFNSVDMHGRRTIFNIGGNKFRLIARVNFQQQVVFVLHVFTHDEYSKGEWKK
jgi:mRNA interferase HigB